MRGGSVVGSQPPKANAPGSLDIHTNPSAGLKIPHVSNKRGSSLRNSPLSLGTWYLVSFGSQVPLGSSRTSTALQEQQTWRTRSGKHVMPPLATKACCDLVLASEKVSFAQFRSGHCSQWAFGSRYMLLMAGELQSFWVHSPPNHQCPQRPLPIPPPVPPVGGTPAAAGGGIPAALSWHQHNDDEHLVLITVFLNPG